jgi:chaperonin GroES
MKLKPLYDKVVVEISDKQEVKSASGLVFQKNMSLSANSTMVGEVVAVGTGRLMSDGSVVPLKVKVGDKVVYSKMQGESYNNGTNDYTILSESCIMAVLEEVED